MLSPKFIGNNIMMMSVTWAWNSIQLSWVYPASIFGGDQTCQKNPVCCIKNVLCNILPANHMWQENSGGWREEGGVRWGKKGISRLLWIWARWTGDGIWVWIKLSEAFQMFVLAGLLWPLTNVVGLWLPSPSPRPSLSRSHTLQPRITHGTHMVDGNTITGV